MPVAFLYFAVKMGLTPLNAVCLALLSSTAFSCGCWTIINTPEKQKQAIQLFKEEFEKQLPRKMAIHLLSNTPEECKKFIKICTNIDIKGEDKLEKIEKKINLFSFMNYKIYDDASKLMTEIEKIIKNDREKEKSIFSEVLIVLDNPNLEKQINEIRSKFKKNPYMKKFSYYVPFLIIISPQEKIDIKDFLSSKTFHYKITLKDISSILKGKNQKIEEETSEFIRKLNILFCYYNELGDEFSFFNSDNKLVLINIEDDTDITIFVNFLLLGRSGSGKSKLANTLLEEMKSIEGGATGFSTTSKKIIIYKKKKYPLRFYDVKGIESDKTSKNYEEIMKYFNIKRNISYESINTIFYCIQYTTNGTIIEEAEYNLFDKLIQFEILIIFIITKTPYDPDKKAEDEDMENDLIIERETIESEIKKMIKNSFKKNYIKRMMQIILLINILKFFM